MKQIISALLLLGSLSANATSFDFAAIADGDGSYGVAAGESGASSFVFTKDGLSVTATGFNATDSNMSYFAYLDSGNAGLGVCQALSGTQCAIASDDNVTYNESLKLVFSQEVDIVSTLFRNGSHGTSFNGMFGLSVDGVESTETLVANYTNVLTGTEFIFTNPNSLEGNRKQFYISALDVVTSSPAPVPVPAAVWLFGTGFVGLVGMAKRRKLDS